MIGIHIILFLKSIQIQLLLKLNPDRFDTMLTSWDNSNTTLVKVKWGDFMAKMNVVYNSNTTLVKVKSVNQLMK